MMKLTGKQLKRLKQRLLDEKQEAEKLIDRSENFGLSESFRESLGDLSVNDNHPGDLGTEMFERGKDIALNELAEQNLEDIELALENIESENYGICLVCGQPIPYSRLEAIPTTRYCVEHVPKQSISQRRPLEESFLTPPFGRTSVDEHDSETFDGEDAWQAVESWGNSDSPAMAEDPEALHYNNLYIESDENDGYVEALESFLATDLYGRQVLVVRNNEYKKYMDKNEGDHGLEYIDADEQDDFG